MTKATAAAAASAAATSEAIVNDAPKLHESFEVGDAAHQGDVIIVRIARLPHSAKPRRHRQVAPGNTPGSRHVLRRGKLFDCDAKEVANQIRSATGCNVEAQYIGPVFVSPPKPTADDLTHPEHGNQGFPAGAVCAVVFQRSWDAELKEARRVLD